MMTGRKREAVFEKLRNLFGGAPGKGARPPTGVRPGGRAHRPAKPRSLKGAGREGGSPGAPHRSSRDAAPELELSQRSAAEIACPNCGEPMLAGWGTTCGKCRPNLVAPKTVFSIPAPIGLTGLPDRSASQTKDMTLGWLLVIRSVDKDKRGTLLELDTDSNVLSRGAVSLGPGDNVIVFEDTFMSNGHATVRRPATGAGTDAFTIRDRKDPPSVNGTFVNSHKLTPDEVVRLSDGDVIKLGATELLFKSLWLPGAASSRR